MERLPVKVEEITKIDEQWVCPHCEQVIGEKDLFACGPNGENLTENPNIEWVYHHRSCGNPIIPPESEARISYQAFVESNKSEIDKDITEAEEDEYDTYTGEPFEAELPDTDLDLIEHLNKQYNIDDPAADKLIKFALNQPYTTDTRGPGWVGRPYTADKSQLLSKSEEIEGAIKELFDGARLITELYISDDIYDSIIYKIDQNPQLDYTVNTMPLETRRGTKHLKILKIYLKGNDWVLKFLRRLDMPMIHFYNGLAFGFGIPASIWFIKNYITEAQTQGTKERVDRRTRPPKVTPPEKDMDQTPHKDADNDPTKTSRGRAAVRRQGERNKKRANKFAEKRRFSSESLNKMVQVDDSEAAKIAGMMDDPILSLNEATDAGEHKLAEIISHVWEGMPLERYAGIAKQNDLKSELAAFDRAVALREGMDRTGNDLCWIERVSKSGGIVVYKSCSDKKPSKLYESHRESKDRELILSTDRANIIRIVHGD